MDTLQISVFIQPVEVDGKYRVSIVTILSGSVQTVPQVEVLIGPGGSFDTLAAVGAYIRVAAPMLTELIKGGLNISRGNPT